MKKAFIIALLALVVSAGKAQKIRTNEPTLGDYLPLLKACEEIRQGKGKRFSDSEEMNAWLNSLLQCTLLYI
jgi:hypothetical protein